MRLTIIYENRGALAKRQKLLLLAALFLAASLLLRRLLGSLLLGHSTSSVKEFAVSSPARHQATADRRVFTHDTNQQSHALVVALSSHTPKRPSNVRLARLIPLYLYSPRSALQHQFQNISETKNFCQEQSSRMRENFLALSRAIMCTKRKMIARFFFSQQTRERKKSLLVRARKLKESDCRSIAEPRMRLQSPPFNTHQPLLIGRPAN